MLEEPYRWVEAIRNRREYLDEQLRNASPVVGLNYADGLLLLTTTPGPRKLFEVYNHIAFAAVGHPADIEKLRKAAIDTAHLEAYNLSASDINLQRLVSFGLAPMMKGAFDEIFRSPFTARVLMAELDPPAGQESFYVIDADGSFAGRHESVAVGGSIASAAVAEEQLANNQVEQLSLPGAVERCMSAWAACRITAGNAEASVDDEAVRRYLAQALGDLRVEAAVLERNLPSHNRFRLLSAEDLKPLLAACGE